MPWVECSFFFGFEKKKYNWVCKSDQTYDGKGGKLDFFFMFDDWPK